jgi:hypothetical protein
MKPFSLFSAVAITVLAALLVSGCNRVKPVPVVPESATLDQQKDYAVLLTNGAVYFGKLEGLGSPWLVMHDVFYIQQGAVDPNTKQCKPYEVCITGTDSCLHQLRKRSPYDCQAQN